MKKSYLLFFSIIFLLGCFHNQEVEEKNSQIKLNQSNNSLENPQKENSATDGVYRFNPEKSSMIWTGKAANRSHTGTIGIKNSRFEIKNGKLINGEIIIDMTTINDESNNQRLENHLKSEDFFSVSQYKEAKFTVNNVVLLNENDQIYQVDGDLTIKGITNPLSLQVKLNKDQTLTGDFNFDRTKYEVKYGSGKFFDNLGDNLIDDEIEIKLNLQGEKV